MSVYMAVSIVAPKTFTDVRAVYILEIPLAISSGNITVVRFDVSAENVAQNTFHIGKMHPIAHMSPRKEYSRPSALPMFLLFRIVLPPQFFFRPLNWMAVMIMITTISITPMAQARPRPEAPPLYTFLTISITGNSIT